MTAETNIREIERYCNNYFNYNNDPTDPTRDHSQGFLELAERIFQFREKNKPTDIISETVIGLHQYAKATRDGVPAGWQQIFAAELSVYKRAKFI